MDTASGCRPKGRRGTNFCLEDGDMCETILVYFASANTASVSVADTATYCLPFLP